MDKKIKYINCINCPKFCKTGKLEEFSDFLRTSKKEGFDEIQFACDLFNDWKNSIESVKIGVKNKENKIKYIRC